jgi:hypothetical protein
MRRISSSCLRLLWQGRWLSRERVADYRIVADQSAAAAQSGARRRVTKPAIVRAHASGEILPCPEPTGAAPAMGCSGGGYEVKRFFFWTTIRTISPMQGTLTGRRQSDIVTAFLDTEQRMNFHQWKRPCWALLRADEVIE